MSVAAASGAVSAHQPTQEQIRLAQLIEDKKHDQPEVQDIVRRVLDVVANSNQEDALLALYDCDYDYEKAVALLIEKGHEVGSEWRTATNHKTNKKQQQQQQKSISSNKNGHERYSGETDENAQQQHRGRDGSNPRGKSRGGRGRNSQQQQNGSDLQNANHSNENIYPQRSRGGGSTYRGRHRGGQRGGSHRPNDRNYQQVLHDGNLDNPLSSDTKQRSNDVSYSSRRGGDGGATISGIHSNDSRQTQEQQWDVGNWNGETLIYSRTTKENEQLEIDLSSVSKAIHALSEGKVSNGQSLGLGISSKSNIAETNTQQTAQSEFDPVEATRQIKNVIGIGQVQQQQQQQNVTPSKSLIDIKPMIVNPSAASVIKSNPSTSKSSGQISQSKATPPPVRIPQQPVVFSDRFNGGLSKIDVQFGNLTESFDEPPGMPVSVTGSFFSKSDSTNNPGTSAGSINSTVSSVSNTARAASLAQHSSNEKSAFMPTGGPNSSNRASEQLPVMNQRAMPSHSHSQQPSMTMKPVVTAPTYAVHPTQPQINNPNVMYRSMQIRQPQQHELENNYDPGSFQITEFGHPYQMAPLNAQQQGPPHYLLTQPAPPLQQISDSRGSLSNNVQTSNVSTSSASTTTSSSTTVKKAPTVPPGILLSANTHTGQSTYGGQFLTPFGVPLSVGNQQQAPTGPYGTLYDPESIYSSQFLQYSTPQQAQSPTGTYGSVTPPVPQQNSQQSLHNINDSKTMGYAQSSHQYSDSYLEHCSSYGGPVTENLLLLQQYAIQQSNNQQQGQQGVAHTSGSVNYYVGHPVGGAGFSSGHPIMFAAAGASMTQQPPAKQQGTHYNQRPTGSSNKDGGYMYAAGSGQSPQAPNQSANQQQQGASKQQRGNNNSFNNQQNQTGSFS